MAIRLWHALSGSQSRKQPTRRRSSWARPLLERLEDRLAPATLYWAGSAGSNWDADNWATTLGGSAVAGLRPANADTLKFTANSATTAYSSTNNLPALTGLATEIEDSDSTA